MAENKDLKKTPAKGESAGMSAARSGEKPRSAKTGTVTATAASKAPAKKGSAAKKSPRGQTKMTSAAKKPNPKKGGDEEQLAAKVKRRSTFSEQFLPYIFAGIALIISVFLVLNALGDAETANEHLAGVVGFYFCQVLFGCFGWTAYLLPLLFVNLAVFWRRYCEENLVAVKIILSVLLMVLISAVIHVGVCTSDPALSKTFDVTYLYNTGAAFESGGVVGGVVGNLLYTGLKLPGTIALAVVTLPLIIMLLVGVTPAFVFGKLWAAIKAWRERSAAEKEARREEKEAEAEAERKAATAETYREKRARMDADRRRAEEVPSEEEPEALPDEEETVTATTKRGGRRTATVDTETGEILEESGDRETVSAPAKPAAEEEARLPFFESEKTTSSATADAGEDDLNWEDEGDDGFVEKAYKSSEDKPRRETRGDQAQRIEDQLFGDEEAELYEERAESMPTDLDEEADPDEVTLTAAEAHPTATEDEDLEDEETATAGNYSIVYSAEAKPADSVMVTINKQEFAAVAESGLSEEELVLSTAHTADELPAEPAREYRFPSVDMLTKGSARYEANDAEIAENTRLLREVLESFHIRVKEISCSCGPTITRFEVKPDTGVRVRSIANLVDDIAMNLAKAGVRIEAPIPGKAAVGIEVPNAEPSTVYLRNILETPEFRNHKSRIAACLGADVSGRPVILDINKMPHLLIAGATGMGKSVCINSIIMSILYKAKPDEVKLILVDPKKVEFAMYRELPHLFCPIVSDPKQAAGALYSAVNEMERRFGLIEEVGVRNLAGYNEITAGDPERPPLPQIVIIIDELADLMMTAPADVETAICRLAQKARAAGIHLVIGTQRPSVDVITGLIKANVPSRIAFTVASSVDSRTIIDTVGADKLIGRGDMLYAPVGVNKPMRCQGTFVSESEVERVVTFIKENNEPVEYDEEFIKNIAVEAARCGVNKKKGEQVSIDDFDGLESGQNLWGEEPKFWEALDVIVSKEKIGTSALQRAIKLGYGRAAGIIDRMEEYGFVGPDPGNKTGRDVRITHEQLADYKANGLPGKRGGCN